MKTIELTQRQKSRLLEMCNKLFPEYPNLEVRDSMEDFCMKQNNCFIELNETHHRTTNTVIHWFEICWKILNKLLSKKSPIEILEIVKCFGVVCFNNSTFQHPVDYLYKQFKELK